MNMEEALANPKIRWKILAEEISAPLLPDDILKVIDTIIDWSDHVSFTTESARKAKASSVPPRKPNTISCMRLQIAFTIESSYFGEYKSM